MSTVQDRHEVLLSAEYLDALHHARRLIEELRREAALPLPRLVWQAGSLYRTAWTDEQRRRHVG